jgi:hypothetical protein
VRFSFEGKPYGVRQHLHLTKPVTILEWPLTAKPVESLRALMVMMTDWRNKPIIPLVGIEQVMDGRRGWA